MDTSTLLAALTLLILCAFTLGRGRSIALVDSSSRGYRSLNSLPFYYGMLTALWCGIPSLLLVLIWNLFQGNIIDAMVIESLPIELQGQSCGDLGLLVNTVKNIAAGNTHGIELLPHLVEAAQRLKSLQATSQMALTVIGISVAILLAVFAWGRISPEQKARLQVEKSFKAMLLACASLAIITTIGIVLSVLFESIRFFQHVPLTEFIFGLEWSPQTALRPDQVGGSGSFGAVPLFTGTLLISAIALIIAVPTGLMSAIYLSEYASAKVRLIVKPLIEILAGVPTVVYGFFAALTVAPFIRETGAAIGVSISSESALAAGLVMGVMIIPFVSSLSDDVINAVPQSLRDGSLGLGATKSETIKLVIIPAALPGIVGGVLLAASRAIGETMIVVMAAGLAAKLTANPLETVTTITVQIVTLLVGDQEFDSPKTLSAFALGLMLFIVTLALNYFALHIVKKYREQYE